MNEPETTLERINMLACYASEEDTSIKSQTAALLEIGRLARFALAALQPTPTRHQ